MMMVTKKEVRVWAGPGALQRGWCSGGPWTRLTQVRWAGRQQQPTVTGRQEEIERAHSRHLEPPRGGAVLVAIIVFAKVTIHTSDGHGGTALRQKGIIQFSRSLLKCYHGDVGACRPMH